KAWCSGGLPSARSPWTPWPGTTRPLPRRGRKNPFQPLWQRWPRLRSPAVFSSDATEGGGIDIIRGTDNAFQFLKLQLHRRIGAARRQATKRKARHSISAILTKGQGA